MASIPLHALRPLEVYESQESSPRGLSAAQVQDRLALFGLNRLAEPPRAPLWRRFVGHATHTMALVLWGAGLLAVLTGSPALGAVIWLVVLGNAGFSFWQEYRAQLAVASLAQLLPPYARALRDGQERRLPAEQLVPGDVLVLAEGDSVPADARVVEEFGLRVNNAALTGEAVPGRRTAEASLLEGLTELEQPNLVFLGSSVVSGTGRAVVYATGMLTQFGRIARLTHEVQEQPSPLQREIRRVTERLSLAAVALGAAVFLIGRFEVGLPLLGAFLLGLGILVAAVPEGLSPTITLSLAIAVQRLAQHGVLVKKLAMVETLGKVSVICTDKSGTLTQNQMTIREVWAAGRRYTVGGVGYEPRGTIRPESAGAAEPEAPEALEELLTAASLCNNARLNPPSVEQPRWTCLGDQTEAALRVLARKGGLDEGELARRLARVHELPFDARRKRMTTIHRHPGGLRAYVKGAPREVLGLCTQVLIEGQARPLDEGLRRAALEANDAYARRALRVLALARRDLPGRAGGFTPEAVEQGLTLLGLVAMMDPPRREVAGAVEVCRQAGIRLVMVTGDYGLTAESVARRVGMLTGEQPLILTGGELEQLGEFELHELLRTRELVFARMAPEHKLRLVAAYQALGEVVAVTGDGVNDAPALRRADVGIAMGVIGTDVAKEAADLIITDDDFASIPRALEEGRALFDNLRKFVTYIFASNVPEILPFVLSALFKIPLAMGVLQILAIDLGTDLLPALALGTERPAAGVMQRPPRPRAEPLLDRRLLRRALLWLGPLEALLCYAAFAAVYAVFGYAEALRLPGLNALAALQPLRLPLQDVERLATTVFFLGVIFAQVGNAFACRALNGGDGGRAWTRNRLLLLGIAVEIGLGMAAVYLAPLRDLFGHAAPPPAFWAGLALLAPLVYLIDRAGRGLGRAAARLNGTAVRGGQRA